MSDELRIVAATETDVPLILGFIRKLAEYEKLTAEVAATEELLRQSLFSDDPSAEVLVAYWVGEPAGFAVYFRNFSTFLARPGIYLEDVFVEPAYRGRGIGKALLAAVAKIARDGGGGRLNWAVLDWNRSAIEFYRSLGAVPLDEWTIFRLSGDALERLAERGRDNPV